METKRKSAPPDELEQALERAEDYLKRPGKPKPRYVVERPEIDAKAIRESLGMSRQDFAMAFGLSLRTLQNWEEGRREPEGPARTLLIAIKYQPEAVRKALSEHTDQRQMSPEVLMHVAGTLASAMLTVGGVMTTTGLSPVAKGSGVSFDVDTFIASFGASVRSLNEMHGQVVQILHKSLPNMQLVDAAKEVVEHPRSKDSIQQLEKAIAELTAAAEHTVS